MSENTLTPDAPGGEHMDAELTSQPDMWERAAALGADDTALPADGQRVAVIGCGTSWFIAQAYAALRESAGKGITDAFAASEAFMDRDYDAIVALTRSGTTTEVLEIVREYAGTTRVVGIIGDENSPLVGMVDATVLLPFADEESVVQTRFATTALAYLRASLGEDLTTAISDARTAVTAEFSDEVLDADEVTFLGRGWTVGLAHEAALKLREATQSWTESYAAMEYRHGPIAIAAPGRIVWMLGSAPEGLEEQVDATGAAFMASDIDPLAELVRVHRLALLRARKLGLDADQPRNLSRSVILTP